MCFVATLVSLAHAFLVDALWARNMQARTPETRMNVSVGRSADVFQDRIQQRTLEQISEPQCRRLWRNS